MNNFRFDRPFTTRCDWPARLIGVLQRRSGPYVVAVWNPVFAGEELHAYDADGMAVTGTRNQDPRFKEAPLDLVNVADDWESEDPCPRPLSHPVHAHVVKEASWPANCNPLQYDLSSMATDLVRGWVVLHAGFDHKENPRALERLQLVQTRTGERFTVRFTPVHNLELAQQKEKENVRSTK